MQNSFLHVYKDCERGKNMFIHSDDLFMFLIYPLIGAIAYIFALRYQLKEIKKELWEERDKVRELQEQLIKKQK